MNRFLYTLTISLLLIIFLHSCSLFNEQTAASFSSNTATIKELFDEKYRIVGMLRLNDAGNKVEDKYFQSHQKFYYNDAGLLTTVSNHSDPANVFDETLNIYDTSGNLLKTQYFSRNGKTDLISTMNYNQFNQLIFKSTASAFATSQTIQYSYNEEGKLVQEIREQEGISTVTIKYLYDKIGNLQSEEYFGKNELELSYLYSYDKKGNRIETRKAEGGEQKIFMTTTFDYNKQQKIISEKCSPKGQAPCFNDKYWEYNSKGFLTRVYEKIDNELITDKQYLWE